MSEKLENQEIKPEGEYRILPKGEMERANYTQAEKTFDPQVFYLKKALSGDTENMWQSFVRVIIPDEDERMDLRFFVDLNGVRGQRRAYTKSLYYSEMNYENYTAYDLLKDQTKLMSLELEIFKDNQELKEELKDKSYMNNLYVYESTHKDSRIYELLALRLGVGLKNDPVDLNELVEQASNMNLSISFQALSKALDTVLIQELESSYEDKSYDIDFINNIIKLSIDCSIYEFEAQRIKTPPIPLPLGLLASENSVGAFLPLEVALKLPEIYSDFIDKFLNTNSKKDTSGRVVLRSNSAFTNLVQGNDSYLLNVIRKSIKSSGSNITPNQIDDFNKSLENLSKKISDTRNLISLPEIETRDTFRRTALRAGSPFTKRVKRLTDRWKGLDTEEF